MLETLRSQAQNDDARRELERRGLSMLTTGLAGVLGRRLGIERLLVGDPVKSWDVLRTAQFIEAYVPKHQTVVDFGAFRSEITGVLHRLGYSDLRAVDLNPRLLRGPYSGAIRYTVADFLATKYPDGSCAAITSISAVEHGHSLDRLLAEVARLLRPGGYFLASTDYWPDKIDTGGIRIFDLDWTIFSASEMEALFAAAAARGLHLVGAVDYGGAAPIISFAGKRYTFAWFALQKRAPR